MRPDQTDPFAAFLLRSPLGSLVRAVARIRTSVQRKLLAAFLLITLLFLLMGADSLHDLPTWREPARICELSLPAVVRRGGAPEPDFSVLAPLVTRQRLEEIKAAQVRMPLIELSSTDLRQRAAAGHSLRYRTPRAVEKYIETHRLYSSAEK